MGFFVDIQIICPSSRKDFVMTQLRPKNNEFFSNIIKKISCEYSIKKMRKILASKMLQYVKTQEVFKSEEHYNDIQVTSAVRPGKKEKQDRRTATLLGGERFRAKSPEFTRTCRFLFSTTVIIRKYRRETNILFDRNVLKSTEQSTFLQKKRRFRFNYT